MREVEPEELGNIANKYDANIVIIIAIDAEKAQAQVLSCGDNEELCNEADCIADMITKHLELEGFEDA